LQEDDREHGQGADRVGPPPAEQLVQADTGQQGQRQIRAPALALWKERTGREMGSRALVADAAALDLP
jgi:hypothetical protein